VDGGSIYKRKINGPCRGWKGSVKIRACRGPRMACCVRHNVSISIAKEYMRRLPSHVDITQQTPSTTTSSGANYKGRSWKRLDRKATYAQRSLLYYAEQGAATEMDTWRRTKWIMQHVVQLPVSACYPSTTTGQESSLWHNWIEETTWRGSIAHARKPLSTLWSR
jgi:hypothetical protein